MSKKNMTITEKILASAAHRSEVKPGEFIEVEVTLAFGNDITAPLAIQKFHEVGVKKVCHPERIFLFPDHFTPNKDIKSAEQCKLIREFAREFGIRNHFEVGRVGIEHAFLPEQGYVLPGDVIVGADSHTCTYGALGAFATGVGSSDLAAIMASGEIWLRVPESIKIIYTGRINKWVGGKDLILATLGKIGVEGALYKAVEFEGEVIRNLNMEGRLTLCNMVVEAGGKNGIIAPDEITLRYIKERARRKYQVFESSPDAGYSEIIEIDCSTLQPQVAFPPSPANVKSINEVGEILIDQVVIGSCTNGRISDLREAASILKGRKIHPEVRAIIIPATQQIYLDALQEGLLEIFIKAGCVVSPPTCGPCLGGHMGILAKGERALATTNRNFIGRMGSPESEVYLSNPAVAAASAIKGKIASPEELER